MNSRIRTTITDGVARVAMDDGKVNALSADVLGEIAAALDEAERAGAIVVLTGRDGLFSAGFDLATFRRGLDATVEMLRAGASLIERFLTYPRPVVTVCAGHAYPMGAFLMMAADVRLVVAGPWRIGMNEVAISLTVPHFAIELARHRLSPAGFARISTAGMFGPEEAMRLGYVDRVVEAGDLDAVVSGELERLRMLDASSFTATKARVNAAAVQAIRDAVSLELPQPQAA